MTTDRELLFDMLYCGIIPFLKKVTEAELDYLFRSMEFSRQGYSDLDDRAECDIHHISFRLSFEATRTVGNEHADTIKAIPVIHDEGNYKDWQSQCPLCILRRILSLDSYKKLELTKDEYAKRLKENGYTKSQIKNIVSWKLADGSWIPGVPEEKSK